MEMLPKAETTVVNHEFSIQKRAVAKRTNRG